MISDKERTEEYLRHKKYIEELYQRKILALQRLYPDQWKKDRRKLVKEIAQT